MTDAHDFAQLLTTSGYSFGLTHASVAAGLRRLADDVEAGRFAVQEVRFEQDAKAEDFTISTWRLRMQIAERKE